MRLSDTIEMLARNLVLVPQAHCPGAKQTKLHRPTGLSAGIALLCAMTVAGCSIPTPSGRYVIRDTIGRIAANGRGFDLVAVSNSAHELIGFEILADTGGRHSCSSRAACQTLAEDVSLGGVGGVFSGVEASVHVDDDAPIVGEIGGGGGSGGGE